MTNVIKYEVFRILKKNSEGLTQTELVSQVCEKVEFKKTKVREEILRMALPIADPSKDGEIFPSIVNDRSFTITGKIAKIYKLNKEYLQQNEMQFKNFIDNLYDSVYEFGSSR